MCNHLTQSTASSERTRSLCILIAASQSLKLCTESNTACLLSTDVSKFQRSLDQGRPHQQLASICSRKQATNPIGNEPAGHTNIHSYTQTLREQSTANTVHFDSPVKTIDHGDFILKFALLQPLQQSSGAICILLGSEIKQ